MLPVVLTIAGSDPSGGAGIQADLKVFCAFDVYGAAAITALTAQDTTGVHAAAPVPARFVGAQLDAVLGDLHVTAAKTGMLGTPEVVELVAERFGARPQVPLVVDPVLRATSGDALAFGDVTAAIRASLLPRATLVTPNLDEAAALLGRPVTDVAAMRDAARALVDAGAHAALVTGGHLPSHALDVLAIGGTLHELDAPRVPIPTTHGTGCSLSAAIAARLAHGDTIESAVACAKRWIARALLTAPAVGRGARPVDHSVRPLD